jgi:hypothetical protein
MAVSIKMFTAVNINIPIFWIRLRVAWYNPLRGTRYLHLLGRILWQKFIENVVIYKATKRQVSN